jgi:hypothetical protein
MAHLAEVMRLRAQSSTGRRDSGAVTQDEMRHHHQCMQRQRRHNSSFRRILSRYKANCRQTARGSLFSLLLLLIAIDVLG